MEDCFGFTEDEVKKMLIHFSLEKEMGNIREWYNGYIFGNGTVIYNPWSIVNYLSETLRRTAALLEQHQRQ